MNNLCVSLYKHTNNSCFFLPVSILNLANIAKVFEVITIAWELSCKYNFFLGALYSDLVSDFDI